MQSLRSVVFLLFFLCLAHVVACGTVKSVIPGMGGDEVPGGKLHVKVTPEEAIKILQKVAPENGWQVVSIGDQFDMQGLRGKYFRLETDRFLGGIKQVSGVFFSEPTGAYVAVGNKETGLPENLVAPLTAAIDGRGGEAEGP